TQLEKIDMIDYADFVVINKFERKGSEDAKRMVQKQYQRSHGLFDVDLEQMRVYGTIASQFNEAGTNALFAAILENLNEKYGLNWKTSFSKNEKVVKQNVIIPNEQRYYLREITDTVRKYHRNAEKQAELARRLFQIEGTLATLKERETNEEVIRSLEALKKDIEDKLTTKSKQILAGWEDLKKKYGADKFVTKVRDKEIVTNLKTKTLSGLDIPKVSLPKFKDYGEILRWVYKE